MNPSYSSSRPSRCWHWTALFISPPTSFGSSAESLRQLGQHVQGFLPVALLHELARLGPILRPAALGALGIRHHQRAAAPINPAISRHAIPVRFMVSLSCRTPKFAFYPKTHTSTPRPPTADRRRTRRTIRRRGNRKGSSGIVSDVAHRERTEKSEGTRDWGPRNPLPWNGFAKPQAAPLRRLRLRETPRVPRPTQLQTPFLLSQSHFRFPVPGSCFRVPRPSGRGASGTMTAAEYTEPFSQRRTAGKPFAYVQS